VLSVSLDLSKVKLMSAFSFRRVGVEFQISNGAQMALKSAHTIFGTLSGFSSFISIGASVDHFDIVISTLSVSIFHTLTSASLLVLETIGVFIFFSYFHSVSPFSI
jgi:hypothetical protein